MIADIAVLDLSMRRRSLVWSALGIGLVVIIVAGLYTAAMGNASVVRHLRGAGAAAAAFGSSGTLTTPSGWLNAGVYATVFPLLMLLLTVVYGGRALTRQDEDGTLGLIASLPVHRPTIVLQKSAVMLAFGVLLGVVVGGCTLVLATLFGLSVSYRAVVTTSAALVLLGLDFGLITMAIATLTRRGGRAIAIGAVIAAASYALGALAQTIGSVRPVHYASLFYWAVQNGQITYGVRPLDFAVLGLTGVAALGVTMIAFQRLDLR